MAGILKALDARRYRATFATVDHVAADLTAFDCIVPLELPVYDGLRLFGDPTNALIPAADHVALMHDKQRFTEFMETIGYGNFVPRLLAEEEKFPFIYKKKIDEWGVNSQIIRSEGERRAFEATIDPAEYFRQEYVSGRSEYVTHMLALNGRVYFDSSFAFTFDQDHFVKGKHFKEKGVARIETQFCALFGKILSDLHYTGTCCFNFKIDGGEPKIFEINPRYGGSLRRDINAYLEALLMVLELRRSGQMAPLEAGRLRD